MKPPPEKGTRFGRLTVIEEAERYVSSKGHTKRQMRCVCDCGSTSTFWLSSLKRGNTRSCGCLHKEMVSARFTKKVEGVPSSQHPLKTTWQGMMQRVYDRNAINYYHYGARGIKVCKRWHSFDFFVADMGPKPSEKDTLDREDTNGDYCPSNCRWVDRTTQNNNARSNTLLTFEGVTLTVTQWARRVGLRASCIRSRIRYGWSVDRILTEPSKASRE